jgi:hypothetical protein
VIPSSWPYPQQTYEAFAAIKAAGYTGYCCGYRDAPHVLVATYDWDHYGYLDIINIRSADRTIAARLPKYDDLDIFAPTRTVWHYMGALQPAVNALLQLPPPYHPDAPHTVYPAPVALFVASHEQQPMTVRPGRQHVNVVHQPR